MNKQIELLGKEKKAYGGELLKTRKGRSQPRPIDTRNTMHVMLRSSQATGDQAFRKHAKRIGAISERFAEKYGVRIVSMLSVGGHLHIQLKLKSADAYAPFIRATTAAISMAVTGASRWNPAKVKFWDYRPFTRTLPAGKESLDVEDCVSLSELEGESAGRSKACVIIAGGH